MTLPPGQRAIDGFPRFGAHLGRPAPDVPPEPAIEITGAVSEAVSVPITELARLPRIELTADFHCVAGWSATDLQWGGVAFASFYRSIIEPLLNPQEAVTHLIFRGLDGHKSLVAIEDALADDVLIADHLEGRPLGADHGAPARLLSPSQYGYISTKHLCRIELHTSEPRDVHRSLTMRILAPHNRARVWQEERHQHVPGWALRPGYRLLIKPISWLIDRGG